MRVKNFILKNKTILMLMAIILIAIFFRFYRLTEVPPPLYPDEAAYAMDSLKTANTNEFKVYYPANNGREGLFMWINALSFKIFGPSLTSFKLIVAFFGVLTVLGVYLLAKEVFDEKIGLLASFFTSFSFWPVNFSRVDFRADLTPFFTIFAFYFLLKGIKNKKIWSFILGGIFLGLGFYTYLAYRMIVLVLLGFFVILIWKDRKMFLENIKGFSAYIITGIITALPIGLYFLKNPQDFIGRASGVSVFSMPNPILEFLKSLGLNFASFFVFGDLNWRHNFSGWPILIFPLSLFFAIGLALFLIKSFNYLFKKERSIFYLLFILWFLAMILPAALTAEGNPHSLRLIGEIPPVFIITGFGFYWVYQKMKNLNYKKTLTFALVTILLILPIIEFSRYYIVWANKKEVHAEFAGNLANIANYFNDLPPHIVKYVICNIPGVKVDGYPVSSETIKFLTYNKSEINYLNESDVEKINPADFQNQEVIFSLMKFDERIIQTLKNKFPRNQELKIDLKPGTNTEFYIMNVANKSR